MLVLEHDFMTGYAFTARTEFLGGFLTHPYCLYFTELYDLNRAVVVGWVGAIASAAHTYGMEHKSWHTAQ